jgi:hypothetical protein
MGDGTVAFAARPNTPLREFNRARVLRPRCSRPPPALPEVDLFSSLLLGEENAKRQVRAR